MPIVRWPGGCFVSSYHWVDGVGPERTPAYDKAWNVEDPNTFGTDEYVKWCRKVGCEPYICTNAGTGTAEEMSDWVEYCNLNVGKWGRMRISNGSPEPFNVKYWSVGNENWGGHEIGAKTVQEWGPLVCESAKMMRSVTHDAKLFAAATIGEEWTLPLLEKTGYLLDYISIHGYWDPLWLDNNPADYLTCMMKTDAPDNEIMRARRILEKAGFGDGSIRIAFDEWNLRGWHHPWHGDFRRGFDIGARDKNDINATYTMADALFSACFLNACLRNSDIVDIACFSPVVNARGAICTNSEGIVRRTTFYVFKMYTGLLEKYVVPVNIDSELLRKDDLSTKVFDVVLTSDPDGKHYVYSIINKDPERDVALDLGLEALGVKSSGRIEAQVLCGRCPDDYNDFGDEHVVPQLMKLETRDGKVVIPAHSLTFIEVTRK